MQYIPVSQRTSVAEKMLQELRSQSGCNRALMLGDVSFIPEKELSLQVQQNLIEYEESITHNLFAKIPCNALCLYDKTAFSTSFIHSMEAAHPVLLAPAQ